MYSKEVMKRFSKPKNAGCMKNADGVGEVGNTRCGDILRLYIKVKNNKIVEDIYALFFISRYLFFYFLRHYTPLIYRLAELNSYQY